MKSFPSTTFITNGFIRKIILNLVETNAEYDNKSSSDTTRKTFPIQTRPYENLGISGDGRGWWWCLPESSGHKENVVNFCQTECPKIRCRTQIPHNIFAKMLCSPIPGLNRVNSLMCSDNKTSNILKQTYNWKLQARLSMYGISLPPDIKPFPPNVPFMNNDDPHLFLKCHSSTCVFSHIMLVKTNYLVST